MTVAIRVYDYTLTTLLHTLTGADVSEARWSDEAGGGGGCSLTVPMVLLPDPGLLDECTLVVAVDGVDVAPYAARDGHAKTWTIGEHSVRVDAESLLPVWGRDGVIWPSYAGDTMPRAAADERVLSWASKAYDHTTDASEPWDKLITSDRSARPTEGEKLWPTGTGAIWISAADPELGDRKMFRSTGFTLTEQRTVRVYASGDETTSVILGDEVVCSWDSVETGKKTTQWAERILGPGDHMVAADSVTHVTTGGDGIDPIIIAVCTLDDDGDPDEWMLETNGDDWVACRRQVTGDGSTPPGPTPGALAALVIGEAADRGVTVWQGVTIGFDSELDSDGVAWSAAEERVQRYVFDTIADLLDGLGDVAADFRLTPAQVLEGRVFEGQDRTSVTIVAAENILSDSDTATGIVGNVGSAKTKDGWTTRSDPTSVSAHGRREYGVSLGTAPSLSQGERILDEDLKTSAWQQLDADVEFVAQPGCVPYVDFRPGDTVTVVRAVPDDGGGWLPVTYERRVLSLSGRWDGGTVFWSIEGGEPFE